MAQLDRTEARVLASVRFKPRAERWDHPTLTALQGRRMVASVDLNRRRGPLSNDKLWSITGTGIVAYDEWRK